VCRYKYLTGPLTGQVCVRAGRDDLPPPKSQPHAPRAPGSANCLLFRGLVHQTPRPDRWRPGLRFFYPFNGCSNQLMATRFAGRHQAAEYFLCPLGVHEGGWVGVGGK
jgi:hypothetical protein